MILDNLLQRMPMHTHQPLIDTEFHAFQRDGYLLRKAVFSADEMATVNDTIRLDPAIQDATYALKDSGGASTELALWYSLNDDVFGAVARSERVGGVVQALLEGPICFYHSKLTLKRPRVGGAWDWHQDYGYWYRHGFQFPHMVSVFVAVDASTRHNGCLQVLRGSHQLGRLDHGIVGGQTGADMERVEQAMKIMEHVHVEMEPGDAMFFHSNLLHASGRNNSEASRNVLLTCYSKADNPPYKSGPAISHTPIDQFSDEDLTSYRGSLISSAKHRFHQRQE